MRIFCLPMMPLGTAERLIAHVRKFSTAHYKIPKRSRKSKTEHTLVSQEP